MSDYRRFLGRREEQVLPVFGGNFVDAEGRRLVLESELEPGWWRCAIQGRRAAGIERSEAPDLSALEAVRGAYLDRRLVEAQGRTEVLALLPAEEPARFAPLICRRWWSGDLLLDQLELEGEAEEAVRRAFEDRRPIGELKGVQATLRAAFGYAVASRAAAARGIALSPIEVRSRVLEIAEQGEAAVTPLLARLVAERAAAERRHSEALLRRRAEQQRVERAAQDPLPRAEAALAAAGAALLAARRLGPEAIEVRFRFDGERFVSIVHPDSLQVIDAGICLDGEDGRVTLDSLPSVIREATEAGRLVITRRAG